MNSIFELIGYLGFPNLDFVTSVPLFAERETKGKEFYRQRVVEGKIQSFEKIDSTGPLFGDYFRPLASKIIKVVGDSAVYIQANLGPVIVSASLDDYVSDVGKALRANGPDSTDPVLGLELAECSGDEKLAEMYFRRVARAAYSINAESARSWSSRHRLALRNPTLLNDIGFLDKIGPVSTEVARESHVFARRGFSDSQIGYFCSGFVLEYMGLFDDSAINDPIIKFARPISEVPSSSVDPFVVFVSLDDFLGSSSDANFMLDYTKRGLYAGGSLVLLVDMLNDKTSRSMNIYGSVSRCLDVISHSMSHASASHAEDFVCILFTQDPTSLRRAIRARTGARRLEEMTALFSARLKGRA